MRALVPGHGRAAAVAALEARPEGDAVGILQQLVGHLGLGQAELLALVHADRAAQAAGQGGERACRVRRRRVAAPAGRHARHVVVGNRPAGPARGHLRLQRLHRVADVARGKIVGQQLEAVAHVQARGPGVFRHRRQRVLRGDLAQRGGARVVVEQGAQVLQEGEVLRLGVVVPVVLESVGVVGAEAAPAAQLRRLGRVVAQLTVVEAEVDRIEAEAVDAAVEPEAHVVQLSCAHVRVVEIEVGLTGEKVVQVVLTAPRLPLPGHAAEDRQPVVRRRAVRARVGPHVPVGPGVVAALAALAEPGVAIGGVAENLVDDDLQAQTVRLLHDAVEVGQGAEQRIDVAVVGDVVAEVRHGRGEEGRDPDRVHAEAGDVVQSRQHAGQVAHAVVVRVLEAARIDLVDDGAAPPGLFAHVSPALPRAAAGDRALLRGVAAEAYVGPCARRCGCIRIHARAYAVPGGMD